MKRSPPSYMFRFRRFNMTELILHTTDNGQASIWLRAEEEDMRVFKKIENSLPVNKTKGDKQ